MSTPRAPQSPNRLPADIGVLAGFRNKVINGDFDYWVRGTSFSGPTGYDADRSLKNSNGSGETVSVTRQSFVVGQTEVPGNPRYYRRFAKTVAGSGQSFGYFWGQGLEGARTLAGKKATLTFYAKVASGTHDINVGVNQYFGTGGSPSTGVTINTSSFQLNTSWQKVQFVIDVPSISGKTLGSNGDDCVYLFFRHTFNTIVTIDLAHISIVEGDARGLTDPFEQRDLMTELDLCRRYYEQLNTPAFYQGWASSAITSAYFELRFSTTKRAVPTVSAIGGTINYYNNGVDTSCTPSFSHQTVDRARVLCTSLTNWNGWPGTGTFEVSAEF